jgi:23S rRNA (guanosine2251-2'-O)-methyltransferase
MSNKKLFWIYGRHSVEEALLSSQVESIFVLDKNKLQPWLKQLMTQAKVQLLPTDQFNQLLKEAKLPLDCNHQGVIATFSYSNLKIFSGIKEFLNSHDDPNHNLFIILDQITDPQNVGAIMRSCEVFGVTALVFPQDNSASPNATLVKTSSGALMHLNLIKVPNLARAIDDLKQNNFWVYGLDSSVKKNIWDVKLTGNIALVFGAEGKGLRRLTLEKCDDVMAIPQSGNVASLNVSVACGICLYEVVRQRS